MKEKNNKSPFKFTKTNRNFNFIFSFVIVYFLNCQKFIFAYKKKNA